MKGLYPKIMVLVGGVFAITGIAILAFVYVSESRQIEREGLVRAETLNRMAFEALFASMRQGGGREGNRQVIARLQEVGAFTELRVVKGDPVVRQFGAELEELPRDELERRALAGEEVREVRWQDGYRVVRYVTPLRVGAECQPCHQARIGAINGVISTEISLREYESALRRRRDVLLLTLGGGLLKNAVGRMNAVRGLAAFWTTTAGVVGMVISLTVAGIVQTYLERMVGLEFMVVKTEYLRFWFVWRLIFGVLTVAGVLLYTWDFMSFGLGAEPRRAGHQPAPAPAGSE
nr:hypothetical protein [Anaerolineae bacterium]